MQALITGASSGLGADMARILSKKGYDLILVARRKTKLEKLKKELETKVEIIDLDLSSTYNCTQLYTKVKNKDIDLLINNAGFGLYGNFNETKLEKELDMIDLNIKTVHTLTKLFLKDFIKKDKGKILNVASSAAYMPGPLMATYYATKSYVYNLTLAIYEELKKQNSKVTVSVLCPGPVDTEFNKVAKVKFNLKSQTSQAVAQYAIEKTLKNKLIIIPGIKIKIALFLTKFVPKKQLLKIAYKIQNKKNNN